MDQRHHEARRVVAAVTAHLGRVGIELRETGKDGGYPVFRTVSVRPHRGNPKNLIFGTTTKPDIRFRDTIDNDIEIVDNADGWHVYDRPISSDGLRWSDLQTWRKDTHGVDTDDEAKRTLYRRLLDGLSSESSPSATSTSHTTRSSELESRTCRHCCPRSGCARTPRQSGLAARRPCCGSEWTSCFCCRTDGEWRWRSTGNTTTPPAIAPIRPSTRRPCAPTANSSSATTTSYSSAPTNYAPNNTLATPPRPPPNIRHLDP